MNIVLKAFEIFFIFMLGIMAFPIVWMLLTGDFPGAAVFYGQQEDSELANLIFVIREFFVQIVCSTDRQDPIAGCGRVFSCADIDGQTIEEAHTFRCEPDLMR